MRKTHITLMALAGVAMGNSTILTFDQNDYTYDTDKWALNGLGNGPSASWSDSMTLSDGTVAGMSITSGKFWDYDTTTTSWTNVGALQAMNQKLGTNLTAEDLTSIKIDATAAQSSKSTLTLDFSNNAAYTTGGEIVFYLLVATSTDGGNTANYANFTVTGLDDAAVTWATATGNGFDSSVTSVPVANLAMIRVEGTLTENPVTFAANAAKNGWAMVSYIPEPATATLSLLALVGLAARRRRK